MALVDNLWVVFASTALPILLGGAVERLKLFIDPLQEFRNRTNTKRKSLKELLSQKHAELFRFYTSGTDDVMREYVVAPKGGDADKIAAFTNELFRTITIFGRLGTLGLAVRLAHSLLLGTCALGVVATALAVFVESTRTWLVYVGLGLVALQILAVIAVFVSSFFLDEYDDLT